jgi:hypothetical protein
VGRRQKGYRLATALRREREMRHLIPASVTITYLGGGTVMVHDYRADTKEARLQRLPESMFDPDHREYFRRARRLAQVGEERERALSIRTYQGIKKLMGHSRRPAWGQSKRRARRLVRAARFALVDANIRRVVRDEEQRIVERHRHLERVLIDGDGLS